MASQHPLPSPPPFAELLSQERAAVFLDFDGTLVELAAEPDAIEVPGHLNLRLHDLKARLEGRLALVSGRAIDDLTRHLGSCEIAMAGSHGLHTVRADGELAGRSPDALPGDAVEALRVFAQSNDLRYETKSHGGALHYRSDPSRKGQVDAFAAQVAQEFSLEVMHGKCVAELVYPGTSKASAVQTFMSQPPFAGSVPIFLGDDITDEDGIKAAIECGGFGIAVGERDSDSARYHLSGVAAVHEWLEL